FKAVVFDYGGVIMSHAAAVPEWTRLEDDYNMDKGTIQKTLFGIFEDRPDLERELFEGHYSADELEYDVLPEYLSAKIGVVLPRPLPLLHLWMGPGSTINYNNNMINAVKSLRAHGFHTSILTNNYKFDRAGIKVRTPVDESLFDLIVESAIEGVMKPHRRIYEIVQSRLPSSISPHECIFLDDNKANVAAALAFGWTSILVDTKNVEKAIRQLELHLQIEL
ncbi:hypothetical protein PMAYCL1PPCAC_28818, partial [Pristionchus mayeri]